MNSTTFRDKYCERFGCPPEAFEEAVFRQCFYSRCRMMVRLIRWFDSDFFKDDWELIRVAAATTSYEEFQTELKDFRLNHAPHGFWRVCVLCRVSGQKLTNLASKLFKNQDGGPVINGGTDFTGRV